MPSRSIIFVLKKRLNNKGKKTGNKNDNQQKAHSNLSIANVNNYKCSWYLKYVWFSIV